MKQNVPIKTIAGLCLIIGAAFLLGIFFANGRMRPISIVNRALRPIPERIVIQDSVEDIVKNEQVVVERVIINDSGEVSTASDSLIAPVPPVPPVPSIPPVRPLPPNTAVTVHDIGIGRMILSLFNNLLAVILILGGVWLLLRYKRNEKEKSPNNLT